MANWSNPTLTSLYTDFLTELKARDTDLALQFDGTTTSNLTTGTIRWNSSANRWQKWSGSAWAELTATYALTGLSTTGNATIGGTLGVTGATALATATATTPATGDNSTAVATTAYVRAQAYAPLASPALTGTPTAPTAAVNTNTTQVATTAFVISQAADVVPPMNGTAAVGTSLEFARGDHVHASDTSRAPLASPTFTGTPAAPTAAVGTNTTQLATTAFVQAEIANDAPAKDGTGATGTWAIGITGNAGTATTLATARNINGVSFNGSANITVTASTTAALTAGSFLTSGGTFDGSLARTFAVDATSANTFSKVVARDPSGNFAAGTITASLTGTASGNLPLTGGTLTGDLIGTEAQFTDGYANSTVIPDRGPIVTLGTITPGSGYGSGTYTGVALTGGNGTLATATVVVTAGAVTSVTLTNEGSYYTAGNVLSAAAASLGGTGSGFSIPVATVRTVGLQLYGLARSRIRLDSATTGTAAGSELGSVLFGSMDASAGGRGDKVRIIGVAEGASGGGALQIWTAADAGEPKLAFAFVGSNGFRTYNSAGTFYHAFSNSPTANRTVALPDGDVTLVAGTMLPTSGGTLTGALQTVAGAVGSPGIGIGEATTGLYRPATSVLAFTVGGSESFRLNAAGGMGLGSTGTNANVGFRHAKSITGGTTAWAQLVDGAVQTDVTSVAAGVASSLGTAASTTLTSLVHFQASTGTLGAGTTLTNQIGFSASSTLAGATNDYGFYGAIAAGTGNWNCYMVGAAPNYFAGNVGIGTTAPDYTLNVQGAVGVGKVGVSGTYNLFWAPNTLGQSVRWIRNSAGELAIGEGLTAGTNEHLRIDSSGRLLVGTSSAVTTVISAGLQVQSSGANAYASIGRWDNNAASPGLLLNKSRGSSVGTRAVVQSGDILGEVSFMGDDGTSFIAGAQILSIVDGTPGSTVMPGRLIFSTTGTTPGATPTERLRIDSTGQIEANSLGSAAAPTYSWLSDPDSGLYSPGANQLALSTGGTQRLIIGSDGNVWVNTGALTLNATGGEGGQLVINNTTNTAAVYNLDASTDTTARLFTVANNTNLQIGQLSGTGGNIFLWAGATERVRIESTGGFRVKGAGAAGSTDAFFINGSAPASSFLLDSTGRVGIGVTTPNSLLHLAHPTAADIRLTVGSTLQGNIYSSASDTNIFSVANNPLIFGTNNIERARLDASGGFRVKGAGTAGVSDAFFINGSAPANTARIDSSGRLLVGASSVTANNAISVVQGRSDSSTAGGGLLIAKGPGDPADGGALGDVRFSGNNHISSATIIANRDGGTWTAGTSHPSRLVFSTTADGASGPTERLRIDSTGQIEANSLGTAAAPVLSFLADPNTGIFSPGADQLAVATNGVQRLTVDTAATTSTLPVALPLGAVATPSITFTGDLNTGFWSPAADTLAASTAGLDRLRITAAGRVGINTGSPGDLLEINNPDADTGLYVRSRGANNRKAHLFFLTLNSIGGNTGGTIFHDGNGLAFNTGTNTAAEVFRFDVSGVRCHNQAAPAAVNATATLTIANLRTGIITSTSAAATDMTLPTGTDTQAGFGTTYDNFTFEWSVINTGPSLVRVLAGTAHTIVGSGSVATGTSGRFASRRTAANTFVTYRLT